MKQVKTYIATIYCGLRNGYGSYDDSVNHEDLIRKFINRSNGLCVTCTKTKFYYNNGEEEGIIVGLINYPRFPFSKNKIKKTAIKLANELMVKFNQYRVSIVFPDETIMLENEEKNKIIK